MEIFGVGPSELLFIVLIAIIILGPKDMQKAGRTIGRFLNQLVRSDSWKIFQKTSDEIRNLPRNLMREANVEVAEAQKALQQTLDPRLLDPLATPPESRSAANPALPPSNQTESLAPSAPEPPTVQSTDDTQKNE